MTLLAVVSLTAATVASTVAYLRLPAPSGAFAVGRTETLLVDRARAEPRSAAGERRAVRLITWYPAQPGTGTSTGYVPGFERIRQGLEASGELDPLAVAGLPFVKAHARAHAALVTGAGRLPVVLLSPGNATNVAFYGSLAEDLASHGYVVVGLDHPYQVAAVDIGGGRVVTYEGDERDGVEGSVARKVDERLADVAFVLDRLTSGSGLPGFSGRLDDSRIAIVGHSNGGLTAAQACLREPRVVACVNIDGQGAGGPFSARPDPTPMPKPFLFLTKESRLHPKLAEVFEASARAARVVVPSASHQEFTDGPRFVPRVAPVDGTADGVLSTQRAFVRAFLDHHVKATGGPVFDGLPAALDVYVEVYPLAGRPNLPVDASR